jgi:hypothetical protein
MSDAQPTTGPTAEEIRRDLEHTRTAFHELANSLTAEDFKKKTANDAWSVGQLMWHLAWGAQFATVGADALRGKRQFAPPQSLFNWLNPWITRLGARGANADSVTKKYEESHAKALAALDGISDEDLAKTVKPLYEEVTVADAFQIPPRHFEEHSTDIRKGLGRE